MEIENNFKAGDTVLCVDRGGSDLQDGQEYVIRGVTPNFLYLNGEAHVYVKDRFKLIKEKDTMDDDTYYGHAYGEEEPPYRDCQRDFKPGDKVLCTSSFARIREGMTYTVSGKVTVKGYLYLVEPQGSYSVKRLKLIPNQPQTTNQQKEEETMSQNYTTAVMLFNENIRPIKVSYGNYLNSEGTNTGESYLFKSLDPDLAVGDYVIIPTTSRHLMTVARVEEVDVEVDFDSSTPIKWLIGKVDREDYTTIIEEEESWITTIKASEKRAKREAMKKNMVEMFEDEGIEAMGIVTRGGPVAIAAPTPPTEAPDAVVGE